MNTTRRQRWRNYLLVVIVLGVVGLAGVSDLAQAQKAAVGIGVALLALDYLGSRRQDT